MAAGLDVFGHEPQVPESLRAMPNVVLLPHVGSGSEQTRAAMGRLLTDNLAAWFATGHAITPVAETMAVQGEQPATETARRRTPAVRARPAAVVANSGAAG